MSYDIVEAKKKEVKFDMISIVAGIISMNDAKEYFSYTETLTINFYRITTLQIVSIIFQREFRTFKN